MRKKGEEVPERTNFNLRAGVPLLLGFSCNRTRRKTKILHGITVIRHIPFITNNLQKLFHRNSDQNITIGRNK
ncbi:hypothetical protein GWI33_018956 [Rhynchophorus ferrugineus]|uniref:Uncharacterized protein n=1 Tax=Rhynchophorus ferrugineus TaxID=354439 RepID=A0A834HVB7_RHYFE|nr:hypothetical protein GWI33_018956 [Rhynchophorus ferrugineus]